MLSNPKILQFCSHLSSHLKTVHSFVERSSRPRNIPSVWRGESPRLELRRPLHVLYVKQLSSPGDQGPWYYCNDSHIDRANVSTALTSSDAYMLFYKRSQ